MAKDVIIACDFPTRERTMAFLNRFGDERPYVKIGMELFYAEGPDIVREIKARGHNIFLDLKLCDIPNTVKRAMAVLRGTGADMINLHAFGTAEMMTAALEGLTGPDGKRPLLIAVTQLTSTSEERMHRELLIDKPLAEVCLEYAENAMRSGLDGVVCSPLEAGAVHERCGASFLTVTPGVRFAGGDHGDQVRVTTPERAGELGSDYIVVGRPITWASGIKSPIYCDNRLILTAPDVRNEVEAAIAETVRREFPEAEALMGTATAGIAHAAIAAHLMGLPMGYVRSGAKDHGRQNRIEGKLTEGEKVVVIEDLISTGGSLIETVEALREAGAEVLGAVSIFTYGMEKGKQRLAEAKVRAVSLTDFDEIVAVAEAEGYIPAHTVPGLMAFRAYPSDESWMGGKKCDTL